MKNDLSNKSRETDDKIFEKLIRQRGDIQEILDKLSEIIKEDVCFYDLVFEKKYFSNTKCFEDNEMLSIEQLQEKYPSYSVSFKNEIYGYIFWLNKNSRFTHVQSDICSVVSYASMAFIINIQAAIITRQIENRYKSEFVQDILMKNIRSKAEIDKRAEIFKWTFSDNIQVVIVDIDNYKIRYLKMEGRASNDDLENIRNKIVKNSSRIMKTYFRDAVYATLSDSIIYLIQPKSGNLEAFGKELTECCEKISESTKENFNFTVTIGMGSMKHDIMLVHKAYKEAQMCIKIGRVLYKNAAMVHYDQLGVFRLLYSVYDNEDVQEFCESTLGNIIAYDRKYNAEFLYTLMVINDSAWNLKLTAEKMFMHYNTIKYRYRKIASLLNQDLSLEENRLNISLALKIYQMKN